MTLTEDGLGSFGSLSRALGITTSAGFNGAWFGDPLAGSANPHGLATVLSDDGQRTALGDFVDEVLGPPDGETLDETRWIPLFHNDDPDVGVFAVLEPTGSPDAGRVRDGVGVEHRTGTDAPCVVTRLHVPIAHVRRGTAPDPRPTGGDLPRWLVLGRPGGRVSVSVEATLTDAPPVPGTAYLRGATVSLDIPTAPSDDVGFTLVLQDLQLPGATAPSSPTLSLDALDEVGSDLLEFLVGLVRAQVAALDASDPTFRHVVGLAGALGLREVEHLPPLPLTDLPTRGLAALVDWVRGVLLDPEAEDAWLTQLELLTGGHADLARDAITTHLGPATVLVGLQVTTGSGGAPVLVPWVEVELSPTTGAKASAHVDLLRADTGTGQVTSLPGLRVEAVLGAEAGGAKLLTGSPGIGSVHVGIALDEQRRPTFVLHLTDVDLPNLADPAHPHHHDLIDLSTPDAAVDVADDVLDQALTDALGALGDAGDLLGTLLGISPPAGVTGVSVVDVVRDPLAALRRYWHDLTDNATAMQSALGDLRHLLTGAQDTVTGEGTEDRPWRAALGPDDSPVALLAWRDGGDLVLAVGVGATLDVLDDLTAFVDGRPCGLPAVVRRQRQPGRRHPAAHRRHRRPEPGRRRGLDGGRGRRAGGRRPLRRRDRAARHAARSRAGAACRHPRRPGPAGPSAAGAGSRRQLDVRPGLVRARAAAGEPVAAHRFQRPRRVRRARRLGRHRSPARPCRPRRRPGRRAHRLVARPDAGLSPAR